MLLLLSACSLRTFSVFFFNDTATTEIYTLSLHDALPIFYVTDSGEKLVGVLSLRQLLQVPPHTRLGTMRSEEHTSELQSLAYLVCRLLLEKKKKTNSASMCQNRHRLQE